MSTWVNDEDAALLTDLYELTMLQAYWREGMKGEAVFDLFVRRLPEQRNYLVGAGLDDALSYLEHVRFSGESLEYLRSLEMFGGAFLEWLGRMRFEGAVRAVPEGTVVFAQEPILEVVAPIAQAQLVETFLLNQMTFQTMIASKAARVVEAAAGRQVVDFGARRMHGTDAAMKAARACRIAGVDATSNVLAGRAFGIPVSGTMAHSYVQAHEDEAAAFAAFAACYPETVLLVDTYSTLGGVREVVKLAERLGDRFKVAAVRLDSGSLAPLARESRRILDAAGLQRVKIFASGSLDEYEIARMVGAGAPLDGFGVGTRMGVSSDAPSLDTAYKLVSYAGRSRMKLSRDKAVWPGRKQVYRVGEGERMHDVLALEGERTDGRPLLRTVMEGGRRTESAESDLGVMRERARREIAALPARLRGLNREEPGYEVRVSEGVRRERAQLEKEIGAEADR